jgi:hypothetical protein
MKEAGSFVQIIPTLDGSQVAQKVEKQPVGCSVAYFVFAKFGDFQECSVWRGGGMTLIRKDSGRVSVVCTVLFHNDL